MSRQKLKAVLLAGTLIILVPGAVWATTAGTKMQDRLPQYAMDTEASGPVRLAQVEAPGLNRSSDRERVDGPRAQGPRGSMGRFAGGPEGRPQREPGPHGAEAGPFFGPPHGPPHPDPLRLASNLAAAETVIGVRTDQLDVWRAFTDALQAVLIPPPPPSRVAQEPPQAFALSSQIAVRGKAMGDAAAKLASAIDALKGRLDADQLERLARLEPALLPPPPPGPPPGDPRRG